MPAYGDRHDDFGFNVAVTGSGDVVVAGQASNVDGATGEDVVVALLDGTSGTPLWTRHENGAPSAQTPAGGNGNDFPMGLAVDSGGNPVLALHFNQNSTAEPREDRLVAARFDGATGDSAEFPGGRSFSAKTIGSGLRIRARLEDDQAIRVPTSLTPQAPDTAGAMLTLTNPSTAETATVSLPASGWREARPGSTRRAYQYKDSSGADGPCRKAKISAGRIKLDCKGAFGFSLNEAQQGELAVVFTHGSPETRLCTLFQGGNVRKDEPGVFEGKRQAADRSCPTGLP